jgi:hypothetical protein
MAARKPARAPSKVAVRVLPKRTLALERTHLAFDELDLPKGEAEALIERGIVQRASEEPPSLREPTAEVRVCPECGAPLAARRAVTPEDVENDESWTK